MDRPTLNFGFSPCPNDTFAFHALVHGLVSGLHVTPWMDDIEALNARAAHPGANGVELTKLSIPAYARLQDHFVLLSAGGAAGFGVGPIVVARDRREVGGRIAIPGVQTTAALLLRLLGQFETVPMRFDQIEQAVVDGEVDCGVLIHEGRFTYQAKGLVLLADLGSVWEERMRCPLPLAGIAIRRDLAPTLAAVANQALRDSVEYAFSHPEASRDYVAAHAQEMDPDVTQRHIALYVNDYTRELDQVAVNRMLAFGQQEGLWPVSSVG